MGHQGSKENAEAKDGQNYGAEAIDLSSQEELRVHTREVQLLIGHEDIVRCVLLIDHHRIASASDDSSVIVWCSISGERIFRLSGHTRPVTCMIAAGSNMLITGSSDKSIRIWDLSNGKCLHTLTTHEGSVTCIANLDENRFISGGNDRKLFIWKTDGKQVGYIERQEEENLYCLLPISNNKVVTGSNSSLILAYKTDTRTFDRLLAIHRESVRCLRELNATSFISASLDGDICIWNSDTLTVICTLNRHDVYRDSTKLYKYSVRSIVRFGENAIAAAMGYGFGIFNTSTGHTELEKLDAHEAEVTNIISFADKMKIITCSVDSKIRIWNIKHAPASALSRDRSVHKKRAELVTELSGHTGSVNALVACSDVHFISAGADGLLIAWKDSREENRCRDIIATESLKRQMIRAKRGEMDVLISDLLNDLEEDDDLDDSQIPRSKNIENQPSTETSDFDFSPITPPNKFTALKKNTSWNGRFVEVHRDREPQEHYYIEREAVEVVDGQDFQRRDSLDDIDFDAPPKPLSLSTPIPEYVWDRAEHLRKTLGMSIPDIASFLHQQGYGTVIIDQIMRRQRDIVATEDESRRGRTSSKATGK